MEKLIGYRKCTTVIFILSIMLQALRVTGRRSLHQSPIPDFIYESLPLANMDRDFEGEFGVHNHHFRSYLDHTLNSNELELSEVSNQSDDSEGKTTMTTEESKTSQDAGETKSLRTDKEQINESTETSQAAEPDSESPSINPQLYPNSLQASQLTQSKQHWTGLGNFIHNVHALSQSNNDNNGQDQQGPPENCIRPGSPCQLILQSRSCCSGETCKSAQIPLAHILSGGSLGVCP